MLVWDTIYPEMEASADKQVAGSNRPLASAQKKRIKMREKEHVAHGTLVPGTPWISNIPFSPQSLSRWVLSCNQNFYARPSRDWRTDRNQPDCQLTDGQTGCETSEKNPIVDVQRSVPIASPAKLLFKSSFSRKRETLDHKQYPQYSPDTAINPSLLGNSSHTWFPRPNEWPETIVVEDDLPSYRTESRRDSYVGSRRDPTKGQIFV